MPAITGVRQQGRGAAQASVAHFRADDPRYIDKKTRTMLDSNLMNIADAIDFAGSGIRRKPPGPGINPEQFGNPTPSQARIKEEIREGTRPRVRIKEEITPQRGAPVVVPGDTADNFTVYGSGEVELTGDQPLQQRLNQLAAMGCHVYRTPVGRQTVEDYYQALPWQAVMAGSSKLPGRRRRVPIKPLLFDPTRFGTYRSFTANTLTISEENVRSLKRGVIEKERDKIRKAWQQSTALVGPVSAAKEAMDQLEKANRELQRKLSRVRPSSLAERKALDEDMAKNRTKTKKLEKLNADLKSGYAEFESAIIEQINAFIKYSSEEKSSDVMPLASKSVDHTARQWARQLQAEWVHYQQSTRRLQEASTRRARTEDETKELSEKLRLCEDEAARNLQKLSDTTERAAGSAVLMEEQKKNLTSIQQSLDQYKEKNANSQREIDRLKFEGASKGSEMRDLREKMSGAKDDIKSGVDKIDALSTRVTDLNMQVITLKGQLSLCSSQKDAAAQTKTSLLRKIETAQTALDRCKESRVQLIEKLQEQRELVSSCKGELAWRKRPDDPPPPGSSSVDLAESRCEQKLVKLEIEKKELTDVVSDLEHQMDINRQEAAVIEERVAREHEEKIEQFGQLHTAQLKTDHQSKMQVEQALTQARRDLQQASVHAQEERVVAQARLNEATNKLQLVGMKESDAQIHLDRIQRTQEERKLYFEGRLTQKDEEILHLEGQKSEFVSRWEEQKHKSERAQALTNADLKFTTEELTRVKKLLSIGQGSGPSLIEFENVMEKASVNEKRAGEAEAALQKVKIEKDVLEAELAESAAAIQEGELEKLRHKQTPPLEYVPSPVIDLPSSQTSLTGSQEDPMGLKLRGVMVREPAESAEEDEPMTFLEEIETDPESVEIRQVPRSSGLMRLSKPTAAPGPPRKRLRQDATTRDVERETRKLEKIADEASRKEEGHPALMVYAHTRPRRYGTTMQNNYSKLRALQLNSFIR